MQGKKKRVKKVRERAKREKDEKKRGRSEHFLPFVICVRSTWFSSKLSTHPWVAKSVILTKTILSLKNIFSLLWVKSTNITYIYGYSFLKEGGYGITGVFIATCIFQDSTPLPWRHLQFWITMRSVGACDAQRTDTFGLNIFAAWGPEADR